MQINVALFPEKSRGAFIGIKTVNIFSELLSLQQATYPTHGMPPVSGHPVLLPTGPLTGRPQMYRPATSIMAVPVSIRVLKCHELW